MKIKANDTIVVIAGKDKGRTGKVLKVLVKKNKVLIENVNVYQRNRKPTYQRAGGTFDIAKPIDISNVALIDPKSQKATRVGYEIDKKGAKKRIARKSGAALS